MKRFRMIMGGAMLCAAVPSLATASVQADLEDVIACLPGDSFCTPLDVNVTSPAASSSPPAGSWSGQGGYYAPFVALTPEQQAIEFDTAVAPSEVGGDFDLENQELPDPDAAGGAEAPFGYGNVWTPQAAICPTSEGYTYGAYSKTWQTSGRLGRGLFTSGYLASYTLGAESKLGANRVYSDALASIDVQVFGGPLHAVAQVVTDIRGTTRTHNASLKAAGVTLWSHADMFAVDVLDKTILTKEELLYKTPNVFYDRAMTREWLGINYPFWIGPVPVVIRATADGDLGIQGKVVLGSQAIGAVVTPHGHIGANVSASVNVRIAEVGVKGALSLINLDTPLTGVLTVAPQLNGKGRFRYDLSMDSRTQLLSGSVKAFAKIGYAGWPFRRRPLVKEFPVTLASWNGIEQKHTAAQANGCLGQFSY